MIEGLKRFNIRVYGLLIENNCVLLVDEVVRGKNITKFPGGGLELGEGPIDCLIREFQEELNIEVAVKEHFYTTDFFQQSAFRDEDQIISIYYTVENIHGAHIHTVDEPFAYPDPEADDLMAFRWKQLSELKVEDVHLLIDKVVVSLLLEVHP